MEISSDGVRLEMKCLVDTARYVSNMTRIINDDSFFNSEAYKRNQEDCHELLSRSYVMNGLGLLPPEDCNILQLAVEVNERACNILRKALLEIQADAKLYNEQLEAHEFEALKNL